jgi:hypothetical protein
MHFDNGTQILRLNDPADGYQAGRVRVTLAPRSAPDSAAHPTGSAATSAAGAAAPKSAAPTLPRT